MMEHLLSKTLLISKVIELIAKTERISIGQARDDFYKSELIKLFDDDSLGLYGESPLYVLSIYEQKKKGK